MIVRLQRERSSRHAAAKSVFFYRGKSQAYFMMFERYAEKKQAVFFTSSELVSESFAATDVSAPS